MKLLKINKETKQFTWADLEYAASENHKTFVSAITKR
jgi:hypothetical protein